MQLRFLSVMANDQESALRFYTSGLGFEQMAYIPMGASRARHGGGL